MPQVFNCATNNTDSYAKPSRLRLLVERQGERPCCAICFKATRIRSCWQPHCVRRLPNPHRPSGNLARRARRRKRRAAERPRIAPGYRSGVSGRDDLQLPDVLLIPAAVAGADAMLWRCSAMCAAAAGGLVIAARRLDHAALVVHVMRPRPVGQRVVWPILVASLRHHVEVAVDSQKLFAASAE